MKPTLIEKIEAYLSTLTSINEQIQLWRINEHQQWIGFESWDAFFPKIV